MIFSIDANAFSRALSDVVRVIPAQMITPTLEHVLIETTDTAIHLTATDGQMTKSRKEPIMGADPAKALVPGKLMLEAARKFKGSISLEVGDTNAVIHSGRSKFTLSALPAKHFPTLPVRQGDPVTVQGATLRALLNRALYAIATDDPRKALTGALIESKENMLTVVALDGFQLCRARASIDNATEFKAIVPRAAVAEMIKMLPDDDVSDPVEMYISRNQLSVCTGDATFHTTLIEGEFIPYEKLIRFEGANQFTLDRCEAQRAIARAQIACGQTRKVVARIESDTLTIMGRDTTCELIDELDIQSNAPLDYETAFNVAYIDNALKTLDTDRVTVTQAGSLAPALFSSQQGGIDILCFVMPSRVE